MIKTIPSAVVNVTPSDTNYITDINGNKTFGTLYVGQSGDIVALLADVADTDSAVTTGVGGAKLFKSVPVGPFPYSVKKVFETGTTAQNILCAFDL